MDRLHMLSMLLAILAIGALAVIIPRFLATTNKNYESQNISLTEYNKIDYVTTNDSCASVDINRVLSYAARVLGYNLGQVIDPLDIHIEYSKPINRSVCKMSLSYSLKPIGTYILNLYISIPGGKIIVPYKPLFKPNETYMKIISQRIENIKRNITKKLINYTYLLDIIKRNKIVECIKYKTNITLNVDSLVNALIHEVKQGGLSFEIDMKPPISGRIGKLSISVVFEEITIGNRTKWLSRYEYVKFIKEGIIYPCKEELYLDFSIYKRGNNIDILCPKVYLLHTCIIESSKPCICRK